MARPRSPVDGLARTLGVAHFPVPFEELEAHPRRTIGARVYVGDIRDVDRGFLLGDAAGMNRGRPLVTLDQVHALDQEPVLLWDHLEHLTRLAPVAAGDHDHPIPLLDLELLGHHSTSGASETIFMNRLARNSRVTGPKIRVPMGSPCRLIRTAAFRSKRITLPSGRRMSLEVRTITARCMSPFFTRPRGIASLTETTMMSPMPAVLRFDPPNTLMHMTRRAPELSATSSWVCICIMTQDAP